MDINSAFPSNYVKASDIAGKELTMVIAGVHMEDMGDDREKPVLYFKGAKKGLVLNRTNAETITDVYGPNTDGWIDKPILLFSTKAQFRGQMVPCIRVRVQQAKPKPPVADQTQAEDDIPF